MRRFWHRWKSRNSGAAEPQPVIVAERLAYRVTEAAEAIGVSKTMMYELIKSGSIPTITIGKSMRVPVGPLKVWLNQQMVSRPTQFKVVGKG